MRAQIVSRVLALVGATILSVAGATPYEFAAAVRTTVLSVDGYWATRLVAANSAIRRHHIE